MNYFLRYIYNTLDNKSILKKIIRAFYKSFRKIINFAFNLDFMRYQKKINKKKLFIYDFRNNPPTYGDLIYFFHIFLNSPSNDKEIIFLVNRTFPYLGDFRCKNFFNKFNYKNRIRELIEIGKLLGLSPNIIHVLNSNELKKFLILNKARIYYPNLSSFIKGIFISNKYVCSPDFINSKFFTFCLKTNKTRRIINSTKFITVIQLRYNLEREIHRNSNLLKINDFLKENQPSKNHKIFIVCSYQETKIIKSFINKKDNMYFTKDLNFNIADDLSLIYHCDFYLGSNSGPSTIRYLSNKPYVIFGLDLHDHLRYTNSNFYKIINDNTQRLIFANKNQFIMKYFDLKIINQLIKNLLNK